MMFALVAPGSLRRTLPEGLASAFLAELVAISWTPPAPEEAGALASNPSGGRPGAVKRWGAKNELKR
jgi:hypothetical protein